MNVQLSIWQRTLPMPCNFNDRALELKIQPQISLGYISRLNLTPDFSRMYSKTGWNFDLANIQDQDGFLWMYTRCVYSLLIDILRGKHML